LAQFVNFGNVCYSEGKNIVTISIQRDKLQLSLPEMPDAVMLLGEILTLYDQSFFVFIYYRVNTIIGSEYNWTSKDWTNSSTRVIKGSMLLW